MKISKNHKKKIQQLIAKMLGNTSRTFMRSFYFSLIDILELKKARTAEEIKQFKKYWCFCRWMIEHMPAFKGIRFWTEEIIHELFKQVKNINSIAWNNINADDFGEYFYDIKKWCASYIFECDYKDMVEMFDNSLEKKEYDDEGNLIETN